MNRAGTSLARLDWLLVATVLGLGAIGVANLQSTSQASGSTAYISQFYWLLVGAVVMVVVAAVDYRHFQRFSGLIYLATVIALALVLVVGKEINGSKRWLDLGFITFQPSEVAKLAVILCLASWFHHVRRPAGYTLRDLAPAALLLGVPMFLVLQEPDLGHTMMLLFIGLTMLAYEKFQRRAVLHLLVVGLVTLPIMWQFVLRDYQKDRILTLLDGETDRMGTGWHAFQAKVAVGSGQLLGKGHGSGTQVAGGFLPENHTDFVFANLAEEHGFAGAGLVLSLYLFLILVALRVAQVARDQFGGQVAVGIAALIFWHVVMNVGMVLNLLPVTGVTLPLLSYGGSSVITVMAAFGLLLNIGMRRTVF